MGKITYRVGIVDDDAAKITQMITMIRLCCNNEDGNAIRPKYAIYNLEPVEIPLVPSEMDMVDSVINNDLDAIIIDYNLSSQEAIAYTGVSLAKNICSRLYEFPVFVLTTYQDDLFDHELFDSYLVFDFARYIGDDMERVELNSKIIEQVNKYRIEREAREKELAELIPKAGESSEIDERIIELDTQLEKSIDGRSNITPKMKRDLTSDNIQALISKIDELIGK
ncbi:MAG: hypothetical protein APF84_01770 [Gracilibacter sp. BRH_c7a]|nr:MAG: hypothetical protein APF84_01770 [Gracilibacter sp. BRH_c7a]